MAYRDLNESMPKIKSFAWKVLRRLHAAGAKTIQFEDIEQELLVAWCLACESYDAESQVKFSTYLYLGMQRHINRWAEKNVDRRHAEVIALNLDGSPTGDEEEGTLADAIPAVGPATDEDFANAQSLAYVKSRLSSRAALFVQLLNDQPQELLEEVLRLEEKARYAREERNISINLNHRLTYVMVLDLMGASRNERKQILDEVAAVSDHYCQQVAP